jgi:hypothetical protein
VFKGKIAETYEQGKEKFPEAEKGQARDQDGVIMGTVGPIPGGPTAGWRKQVSG